LDAQEFEEKYAKRFFSLPVVEQHRLLNLMKFIRKGGKLTESTLKGFPLESIALLDDIFKGQGY